MSRHPIRRAALLLTLALAFGPQSGAQADVLAAEGFRHLGNRCSWRQTWINNEWGLPGLESVATIDRLGIRLVRPEGLVDPAVRGDCGPTEPDLL